MKATRRPFEEEARAKNAAERDTEEAIRAEYENSPEYRLGCELLDAFTGEMGLDAETVAAMMSENTRPVSTELIGARAAAVLEELEEKGELARKPEEYLEDEAFIKLLREVPAKLAVRIADAELGRKRADERVANERSTGRQEILEQLQARRSLPRQTRTGVSATAQPDFVNMSSDEFAAFKRRIFGR